MRKKVGSRCWWWWWGEGGEQKPQGDSAAAPNEKERHIFPVKECSKLQPDLSSDCFFLNANGKNQSGHLLCLNQKWLFKELLSNRCCFASGSNSDMYYSESINGACTNQKDLLLVITSSGAFGSLFLSCALEKWEWMSPLFPTFNCSREIYPLQDTHW